MKTASKKTALGAAALAATALLCLGAIAQAEQAQKGNLIASFHGGISPQRLPRSQTRWAARSRPPTAPRRRS